MPRRRPLLLRYDRPATAWSEALPVGNGRLGAMSFGQPLRREDYFSERLILNEESLWYGGPRNRVNPASREHLSRVRELLLAGRVLEAENLADLTMTGVPRHHRPYQLLGELLLTSPTDEHNPTEYQRELDLDTAIVRTRYRINHVLREREIFCSAADQILAMRLRTEGETGLTGAAYLRRRPFDGEVTALAPDTIAIQGQAGADGVHYAIALRAINLSSNLSAVRVIGQSLVFETAHDLLLLVAANTSFRVSDPLEHSLAQLKTAGERGYDALRDRHIADYQHLHQRVTFELNTSNDAPLDAKPIDVQLQQLKQPIENAKAAPDTAELCELLFQYGRYLLLSSSRPGTLPANLQGLWNDSMTPIWFSNYTTNINLQMNYWAAESCSLSECHDSLLDFLQDVQTDGARTAEQMYGCRGFVVHHTLDLWADTAPSYGVHGMALWPTGGAWLALHAWERVLFNSDDQKFLAQRAYPLLKSASEFFLDFLVPDAQGRLVTAPSLSPENTYRLPSNGAVARMCAGPTMDNQILDELFSVTIQAATRLNTDAAFIAELQAARRRLPPTRIAPDGTIAEWLEDVQAVDPYHRHLSHLFALFPGSAITPELTPELALAAQKSIEQRMSNGGGTATEWSLVWMACLWARLGNGERAHDALMRLLRDRTLPNMLSDHPPFQIDGNLGVPAAIAEMLLQSHNGCVRFLPALPPAWPNGRITGLRARGGCVVEVVWKKGRGVEAIVRSTREQISELKFVAPPGQSISTIDCTNDATSTVDATIHGAAATLRLAPGLAYRIHFNSAANA